MIYEVQKTQTIHSGLKEELHDPLWGFPGQGITDFLHNYLICYNNFCTRSKMVIPCILKPFCVPITHNCQMDVCQVSQGHPQSASWWACNSPAPTSSPICLGLLTEVAQGTLLLTCEILPVNSSLLWQSTPSALLCHSKCNINHVYQYLNMSMSQELPNNSLLEVVSLYRILYHLDFVHI